MAYTYSRSLADFGLNDSSGGSSAFAVLNRNNRGLDFAESDINRPHIFVANMIYNMPEFKGTSPFVRTVVGGWEIAAIVQATSGTSLTPQINATGIQGFGLAQSFQAGITGTGTAVANQRPIRVSGVPCTLTGTQGSYLNPAAWTLVGYKIGETIPNKSTCAGPGTKNLDLSVYKNFSPSWLKSSFLGEAARIQFRVEFFNAFNTVQYGGGTLPVIYYNGEVQCGANPCSITNNTITAVRQTNGTFGPNANTGNFGVAAGTKGGREIQYALKLNF
jgi:hypothetical protein